MLSEKTILLLLIISAVGCVSQPVNEVVISTGTGQAAVNVELADSPDEWSRGLMNRTFLPENSGLLFVFPDSRHRSFWMKNTLIPLDIIFISENFAIVDITTMQPCSVDPCQSYVSVAPAKYVLEVNANYTRENNITTDSRVAFSFRS